LGHSLEVVEQQFSLLFECSLIVGLAGGVHIAVLGQDLLGT